MDERLKLYKVRFYHDETIEDLKDERLIIARNEDEAWQKFDIYARRRNLNIINLRVRELSKEEMKQIEILVPFYKEYET